ncbi:unnamed protein product [Parascedosporium putredinis]|uniref:Chromate ion transporter n=1 Tax=Parascedosporium putredinis TaxID=1442378 RepID=A0A9P1MCT3_9PEZI|nr:unnamed protein product [Parascedosporium putredinis]CAI8002229.1 unnamed protein product [Parascedosporium putredinis]
MAIQQSYLGHISPLKVVKRLKNTFRQCWHLGITAFGGPPVHFQLVRNATKMLYCINLMHDGFPAALFGLLLWSLPGALVMYGLSIGVSSIGDSLPAPVYALLSGLNSATVGIIALAGVQLAEKTITDVPSRLLVFFGASAGLLYNALWYFPAIMAVSGFATVVYDFRWLHPPVKAVSSLIKAPLRYLRRKREPPSDPPVEDGGDGGGGDDSFVRLSSNVARTASQRRHDAASGASSTLPVTEQDAEESRSDTETEPRVIPVERRLSFTWKFGLAVIVGFFLSFAAIMVVRGVVKSKPPLYDVFANFFLAGTIIFGGGPVVIPLLREYVVTEGWVRPRDFLIGVAIIQSLPGPNFNVAVYLGSLAAITLGYPSIVGALLGYVGLFFPGIIIVHGTMGVWGSIRGLRSVKSAIRGVNAAAVGLMYTAVYRLWQIGYIDAGFQQGTSLANEPWWVVVTATSYVGGYWFGVSPPVAIVTGAIMGMIYYGVTTA